MIKEKFNSCKLIVFDFDGVLTDNKVLVFSDGTEAVTCNRSDGMGFQILKENGFKVLILSTEKNDVVKKRAEKLKVPVINNCQSKKETLAKYCEKNKIDLHDVCFIGNDINDLEVMKTVGLKMCPKDAYPCILNIVNLVIPVKGGNGVARYLANYVIK